MAESSKSAVDAVVKLESVGTSRIIQLNRPGSLNTLNLEMVQIMTEAIRSWEKSDNCRVIIITGAPRNGKATFCAGGDVVSLAKSKGNVSQQMSFLGQEYALNHLLGTCKKPVVALMDGVTMGGGAGVSVHGKFRVATENTVFAMPETAIGFIPDVGGTFFLSRLGALGTYLGLTGARLSGFDLYHSRLATHYIPSSRLDAVKSSLAHGNHTEESINNILESFSGDYQPYTLDQCLPLIEECFGKYEVVEIVRALNQRAGSGEDPLASRWTRECLEMMRKASPTALFVTHELLKRAKRQPLTSCLRTEYATCLKLVSAEASDMYEGVTQKLILKTNAPRWSPPTIDAIVKTDIDSLLNSTSDPSTRAKVQFFNSSDLDDIHAEYALPTDAQIRSLLGAKMSVSEILAKYKWKLGLQEKLQKSKL